jgi:hypothetical protein
MGVMQLRFLTGFVCETTKLQAIIVKIKRKYFFISISLISSNMHFK